MAERRNSGIITVMDRSAVRGAPNGPGPRGPARPNARHRSAIPWLRAGHVGRRRLLDRLDQASPGDVVLVSAPAGWGKTALLVDWLRIDPVHTVWVSLSPIDDSDRGFWAILLGALRACPLVGVGNPLHDLVLPGDPSADPDFLAAVADGLHAVPEPLTVVLDNTEELKDPAAADGLRALLHDRPPHVRIVLSGRRDPPIPLGRLRAAGTLVEVRAEQLRFTADEAAAMLAATGYVFGRDLVAAVVTATGGWAAGLRLAAPALAAAEPTDFVHDLVGTDRAMSDYLVEEVLTAFSPGTRQVLERVSICEVVSAPLAAALCDGSEAGEVLDAMERETGLVYRTTTAPVRYVVEPLLRAHLLADLRRRHPETVTSLHLRAARWYAEQDMPDAALDHAVASGAEPVLVDLVGRYGLLLLAVGEHARLREAAERLRREVLTGDPMLALLTATAHLEVGELETAERLVAAAERVWPAEPTPELVALRRVADARRESLSAGRTMSDVGTDAAGQLGLGPMAVLERAFLALAEQRVDTARELARVAMEQAGDNDYLVARCLTVLGAVAGVDGDFPTMAALAEHADARAPAAQWRGTIAAAVTAQLRAYRALLLARPADCLKLAEPALEFVGSSGDVGSVVSNPTLAAILGTAMTEDGEVVKGLELLAGARVAADAPMPALYLALIAVLEHRTAIDLGYVERAREVLDWAAERLPDTAEVLVMRARQHLQLGRAAPAARQLAAVLHEQTYPALVAWTPVDAWALACRLALRSGHRGQALRAARRAVATASTYDVLRPLTQVDEVVELIGEINWPPALAAFTARVLDARRAQPAARRVALTETERAVLAMLSTQRSIGEIAEVLTVSRNTVKTHVRTIYAKLGAHTRREALIAARAGGLVTDA
jgi:LuxR family transcriptional regulator, maltose regulon positive regulatory protein